MTDEHHRMIARVGSDISDVLGTEPAKMKDARAVVREAEAVCPRAIMLDRQGCTGEALTVWRAVFGELFPAS